MSLSLACLRNLQVVGSSGIWYCVRFRKVSAYQVAFAYWVFFLYNGEICPSSPHTQFYVYREREEPLPVPTFPSPMRYRPKKLPHSQLESTSFSNGKGHCAVVTQTVLQEQGVPSHSAMFCAKAFFTLLHKVSGSIWLQKQQYKTVHNGNQNTNRRKTNTRGCTGLYGTVRGSTGTTDTNSF